MLDHQGAPHWSFLETMDRQDLRSLQGRRLIGLLRYLQDNSIFYRNRLSSSGVSFQDIRTVEDIAKLPFTSKQDLVDAAQAQGCVHGELFCGDPKAVLRWHRTSGTTGKPLKIADTVEDWNNYAELSAEALYAMGVRREDIVIVAFGYGPFIAFWSYIAGLEKIESTFIPSGNLNSKERIGLLNDFGATVLMGVPSYIIHLGETARSIGLQLPNDSRIKLIVTTGEPNTPLMKRKIKDLWGIRPMDRMGTTETGGIAFECPQSPGVYHIQEGFLIPEIVDPADNKRVEPGGIGELIVTPLYRKGMPLLRFKTGNVVKSLKEGKCKCGTSYLSLQETENGVVIGRLDKLLKIRGVLIDPIAIENIVRQFEWFGEEYRIIFEKKNDLDEIRVQIELKENIHLKDIENAKIHLMEAMKKDVMLRIDVEFMNFGKLERFQEKAKRIIDLR